MLKLPPRGLIGLLSLHLLIACNGSMDGGRALQATASSSETSNAPSAPAFGEAGRARFALIEGPNGLDAPEPTIGIPWNTDSVFYHTNSTTWRLDFDEQNRANWVDVTPPYQVPVNLDPMLHVDPDTGRIWAGGLHGPCSLMMASDDNGETWLPTVNMCSGADFDHQSLGSGPSSSPLAGQLSPHSQYYCAQLGTISCAVSHDGGKTWGPFVQEQTVCDGFHGHIRVSRASNMMAVPVGACGGEVGMLTTRDGISYSAKTIPESERWTNGFDPSLQFGRGEGWLWYGNASENGIHIALSKDDGETWEALGAGMGVEPSHYLDIGQFHSPRIIAGTFADVQVGDDDRVAFSFLGLEDTGPADVRRLLRTNMIYQCDDIQKDLVWHYYLATSYDAGSSWDVQKLSKDPVQVGGIYDSVVSGSGSCRNLLDFNDMDIDSKGRIHIGWADGCVDECATTGIPGSQGYRARKARLFRQIGGRGLFAEFDR